MNDSAQMLSAVSAVLSIIDIIVRLGGVVVAVILVVRRQTLGRWLIVAGTAVPTISLICNRISWIVMPLALSQSRLDTDAYFAITTGVGGACGGTGMLGYVILIVGIWLLAREGSEDDVYENE